MGLDKIVISQIKKVAKDSGKLDNAIDKIKEKVINKGLELIEESGVDSSQLPINLPQYLRGESPGSTFNTTPDNVCAMPSLTAQQSENTIRLVNQSQIQIEGIYETTNSLKSSLQSLRTPINTLQNSVSGIQGVVDTISSVVTVIKLLPIPTSVPPGIGIPINVITIFADTLDSIGKLLDVAKSNLKIIPQSTKLMIGIINNTIQKLNGVENIISPFLKTLTFIKTVAELRPNCPDVTQEDINNIEDELLSNIQGNLALAQEISNPFSVSDADLEEQLHQNSDPGFMYKNFKFVLEFDPTSFEGVVDEKTNIAYKRQIFAFPSRRIRCTRTNSTGYADGITGGGSVQIFNINAQTNPSLEEEAYSFGSLRILVEEAKFAVDTYTSNITLWEAPQIRENVSGSSDSMVNPDDYTQEELNAFVEYYGFEPSTITQPLPSYIRYGSYLVNLNSSPTDIEYGADRLVSDGSYAYGSGMDISSYIQSGTIQVNKPVNIRMKTFGGTGDPTNSYATGFTEALLTIKRSAAIQDDINPFTGRVKGFDQSAIDDFVVEYGKWSINYLDMLYETFNETTNYSFGGLGNMNFLQKLGFVKEEFFGYNGQRNSGDRPSGINVIVEELYNKSEQLLYNEDIEWLAWKIYGNQWKILSGYNHEQTNAYKKHLKNISEDGTSSTVTSGLMYVTNLLTGNSDANTEEYTYTPRSMNWYKTAKKNNWHVNNGTTNIWNAKAATLSMFFDFGINIMTKYQELYGARTDYNNGAWVGGASTLPIIPTQVGGNNEDITISLQETQLVNRNQTKSEIVGGLDLLGTYTYDLEIIDSLPSVGGTEMNYPTNYTVFYIETT